MRCTSEPSEGFRGRASGSLLYVEGTVRDQLAEIIQAQHRVGAESSQSQSPASGNLPGSKPCLASSTLPSVLPSALRSSAMSHPPTMGPYRLAS